MSDGGRRIYRRELRELIERGERLALVEALDADEFRRGHLPGAVNIPRRSVDELAPRLLPDRDVPVVVYCSSIACAASGEVARRLVEHGYADVRHYAEGKADWIEAELPLETGAPAPA